MGLAKTFLAIGIAIVFTVFIAYGLYVVYEPPENTCWDDYNCYGLTAVCYGEDPETFEKYARPAPLSESEEQRECAQNITKSQEYRDCIDQQETCNAMQDDEQFIHARNSFFIIIVIALLSLIAGVYLTSMEGIGSGFIGGGVLLILWSLIYTVKYWAEWDKYVKLLALFIVLVVMIYIGYKKIESKKKKHG